MTIQEITDHRLNICRECPLYKKDLLGERCDSRKYINPETGEYSFFDKEGYIQGCGCLINMKASNPKNHCVAGKW